MTDFKQISFIIKNKLGMKLSPVGLLFSNQLPENSLYFKKKGKGCITPLIYKSAQGRVVAFDKNSTGLPCSSFYLGYSEWIFPGIEKFLSNQSVYGRAPEKFIKNEKLAKEFLEIYIPPNKRNNTIIYKPLELFAENEKPEIVLFFANADQLSALVYLVHFGAPTEERVVTRFASACMSLFTIPLEFVKRGEKRAVWGFHDVAARKRLPKDLMTFTMTFDLFMEVYENIDESFINTENWENLKQRNL